MIGEIVIRSTVFKHDCDGADAEERKQNAQDYLSRLIGGLDDLIQEHLEIAVSDDANAGETVHIRSQLVPEANSGISYQPARTGEPCLQFCVDIGVSQGWKVSREFAWRLPETQPYRLACDLFRWASTGLDSVSCLPSFTVPHYTELMHAKDDEESYRVLLQCLKSESDPVVNLLAAEDIDAQDPLWQRVHKLAYEYVRFIGEVEQNGLFAALRAFPQTLRKAYEYAYSGFVKEQSTFGPLLFRAFLILRKRAPHEGRLWCWESHESSAVITVLHPALLEMLDKQISYLFKCFNYSVQKELYSAGASAFYESNTTLLTMKRFRTPSCFNLREIRSSFRGYFKTIMPCTPMLMTVLVSPYTPMTIFNP